MIQHNNRILSNNQNRSTNTVSISEAAKVLNVSPKTLRRWEALDLIQSKRNRFNHRVYNLSDLHNMTHQKYSLLPHKSVGDTKPQYYSITKTASLLNVSIKTLRRWEKTGKVVCYRNHRNQRVFAKQHIDLLMKQSKQMSSKYYKYEKHAFSYHHWQTAPVITALIVLPLTMVWSVTSLTHRLPIMNSLLPMSSINIYNTTTKLILTDNTIANNSSLIAKSFHINNSEPIPPNSITTSIYTDYYQLPTTTTYFPSQPTTPQQLPDSLPLQGTIKNIHYQTR